MIALILLFALSPPAPNLLPPPRPPATLAALLDRGVYWPDDTLSVADLGAGLERFCSAEDALACVLLPGVRRADLASVEALCAGADADACVYLAWRRPRTAARACAGGAQRACLLSARQWRAPNARLVAERACRAGVAAGCLLRAELEPDARVRSAQLAAVCADGDARGCTGLLALTGRRDAHADPRAAAHAAARACGLGVPSACDWAIAAWEHGAGVQPEPRFVAALRARACALGRQRWCADA